MIEPSLLPLFQKGFAKTAQVLLARLFSEVWIDKTGSYCIEKGWPSQSPLFLYSTHSSWWDPIAAAFLSVNYMKRRTIAPMDEKEFKNYKSLRFVGLFGVSQGDGEKVQTTIQNEIEQKPETVVWVTPQGQFAPNELEQPEFKSGLSRWATAMPGSVCVPVSIHYHFGHLPRPFVFFRLGNPVESVAKDSQRGAFNKKLQQELNSNTKILLNNIWEAQKESRYSDKFEQME